MANKKIFISHFGEESDFAALLKEYLERDFLGSLDVFVASDGESIAAGEDWLASVERALSECVAMIIICTPASVRRPWINFEAGAAWMRHIPLIPICHRGLLPSDLPMPLSLRQGVVVSKSIGVKRLYTTIATTLNCSLPERDFDLLSAEFGRLYATPIAVSGDDIVALDRDRSIRKRLKEALNHPQWRWRSMEQLAVAAALPMDDVADLLRSDPEVLFKKSRKGKGVMAALRSRVGMP